MSGRHELQGVGAEVAQWQQQNQHQRLLTSTNDHMGFDIYGVNAKSEKGAYFRNSIWWWHRLAQYILSCVEIPEHERQYWNMNGGQHVSEETALLIAKTLREKIASGEVRKHEEEYQNTFYPFSEENVQEFAEFCEESGGFQIW